MTTFKLNTGASIPAVGFGTCKLLPENMLAFAPGKAIELFTGLELSLGFGTP